jgi:hypothetical protein
MPGCWLATIQQYLLDNRHLRSSLNRAASWMPDPFGSEAQAQALLFLLQLALGRYRAVLHAWPAAVVFTGCQCSKAVQLRRPLIASCGGGLNHHAAELLATATP